MLQNSTDAKRWSFVLKPHTLTLPGLAAVLFWGVWFAPEVPQDSLFWGFHQILPSAENETHTHKEKKRLKVRRGENSKGTNTKRKAGASATFGLAMHYALCIILTFERKPLAWILCPSFWQSENLWENKPCQCAQILSTQTLSPQKQLVLTGCRGKKSRRSSKKLALRPHRSAVRKGLLLSEKGGTSAACLPMKLLLSSYTLITRTHTRRRKRQSEDHGRFCSSGDSFTFLLLIIDYEDIFCFHFLLVPRRTDCR